MKARPHPIWHFVLTIAITCSLSILAATCAPTLPAATKPALNADLALTINDLPDPFYVNGGTTYTLNVINHGPDAANDVQVTDTLTGLMLIAATPSQGNCTGNAPIICRLGIVAAQAKAAITITTRADGAGPFINRANVASATPDDHPANNTALEETKASAQVSIYGRVTLPNGEGLGGVTITSGNPQQSPVVTRADGSYQFANLPFGGTQMYTLTPSRPGYTFNPPSQQRMYLNGDNRADFLAENLSSTSAAGFNGTTLAPEAIAAAFGQGLSSTTQAAAAQPLPTTLNGVSVRVKDSTGVERPAPLFFVAPGQINYLIPSGTAQGTAFITVTNGNNIVAGGSVSIARTAPGLFSVNANGRGWAAAVVQRIKADGTQVYEPVAQFDAAQQRFVAVPIDVSNPAEQVFLLLFGTGVRGRNALPALNAQLGGENVAVLYAGAQNSFAGLDQINLQLPASLRGRGEVDVTLTADGRTSNTVRVWFK